ncbi:hypothetical protein AB0I84_06025 [Streptomyces spectabilis]|uniref:hypothetical protein n=1 Tax=Streptomyces spectabilis TaxID=68270 RepID=UPI0033F5AB89
MTSTNPPDPHPGREETTAESKGPVLWHTADTITDDALDALHLQLGRLTAAFDENTRRHQAAIARVDELLGVIARAHALATRWAVLRTYGSAASELLAVLDGHGPAAAEAATTTRVFAALHRSAEQDVTRVIALYEQWVKAGPPPLGTSMSRWWDARLAELHDALLPPTDQPKEQPCTNESSQQKSPAPSPPDGTPTP